ncbi:MAG: acyl-CoA dehydratase activase-related protein [bacterium]|nr:acyl-CoA dehydratase activase-related protein [bacterium]
MNEQAEELVIGIPRGMSFYGSYPFWHGFFSSLGFKIILSDATTKQTMSDGSALVVTETCLPIKIYLGHVINLLNKGVKNIFVPSLQSVAPKIYNCSKIRGLPDLVRNVVKGDFRIIDATLDKSAKDRGLYSFLKEAVKPFGIVDIDEIKKASKQGWKVYNNFHLMIRAGVDYKTALKNALAGKILLNTVEESAFINIALISHGYNIYDDRACMRIFDKLKNMGVKVYTALQLTDEQMEEGVMSVAWHRYWANEYEMTGAAGHYLKDNKIDGIITLNAFGCGPDSLMIENIVRKAKDTNKPVLSLTIDEHTGEAGFVTRLEAFIDMLFRKKRASIVNKIDLNETEYKPQTNICETVLIEKNT